MIRAVCFDLDDTLCDDLAQMEASIRETSERARQHLPGLSADDLTEAYLRRSDAHWNSIDLVVPPSLAQVRRTLWRGALEDCGHGNCDLAVVEDLVALYDRLRRSRATLFPGAVAILDRLRAGGYRLALVTNGVSETHAEKIVGLGIRDHFDAVLMPDEIGWAKPDPRVFHAACAHLGVAPHEAAHIGDSPVADVGGAKAAGLFAVWYNPSGRPFPAQTPLPDAEARTLAEVAEILAAKGRTESAV